MTRQQQTRPLEIGVAGLQSILLAAAMAIAVGTTMSPPIAGQEPRTTSSQASRSRADQSVTDAIQALPPQYRQWVQWVAGLMTRPELEYFLSLRQNYRRDAFMEVFWDPRDPRPETPANELRDRWQQYLEANGSIPYGDPRIIVYLMNGSPGGFVLPDGREVGRCFSRSKELEIWFYGNSPLTTRDFVLVFVKNGVTAPYELWLPGGSLRPVSRSGGLPTTDIRFLCAEELMRFANYEISRTPDYDTLLDLVMRPPQPSPEWLATFTAGTTELPEGAATFATRLELSYPARNQSRTAVRAIVVVPIAEAPGRIFDGQLTHNFLVHGEIIREGSLFESFEYRFEGPTSEGATEIPIGFTRYLRPGPVTLRILLEDVYGDRFSQIVREIDIRSPDGLESIQAPDLTALTGGGIPEDERSLQLLSPGGSIQVGLLRFRTRHTGEFDRVAFFLDDKQVISKRRPPYSVEIDLGETPAPHRVRVVGIVGGLEVTTDQLWLNQGAQRFRVRIIEPRPGGIYPGSLTARAEVQTPDGQPPERVELWVNDKRVANLVEPPYSRGLLLPSQEVAVVRAVAYLADGSIAEDAVVINASGFGEELRVQLVEIRALVVDDNGRPVAGLGQDRFTVFENDQPQEILRFAESTDTPLEAVLLLDRSASMKPHLDRVAKAALAFTEQALLSDDDRVAVLSFADSSSVDQDFTAASGQVERALAGLVANGGTALYDGIVVALNYFSGIPGQGALLLFSDGRDEASRMTVTQTVETARRVGVVIYTIGLENGFPDRDSRRALEDLATETGGRAFFLADLEGLDAIYDQIHLEIRSRYQIVYRPPSTAGGYRAIRVEVEGRGFEVRAKRGYYR